MDNVKNDICMMIDTLSTNLKMYLSGGVENVCTHEAYEAADILKDLLESKYYCTVIEAMETRKEEGPYEEPDIYGYTPNVHMRMGYRGPSSNTGTHNGASMRGYKPMIDQEPYIQEYISENGRDYDEWRDAKRHYNETHSQSDKDKMNEKTEKHVRRSIDTIREMYNESDPALKRDIKTDLTELLSMM